MSAGLGERLRPARAVDLEEVRALLLEAGLPAEGLEDRFGDAYCIAEAEGRLVGAAGVEAHGGYGLLRSVVVSPGWRGRGLGERLVRDRLEWARRQRLEAVYLLTTTAAAFFPRLGFRSTDRTGVPAEVQGSREFASVCPASAAVLVLELSRPEAGAAG